MLKMRLLTSVLGVAALMLGLSACGDDKDGKKPDPVECSVPSDCDDGFTCLDGACVPEEPETGCDPACGGETPFCDEARDTCVACLDDDHCGEGFRCDAGACVELVGCETSDECGEETPVCAGGVCVTCSDTEGCGEGFVCDTSVSGGQCVTCTDTRGCGAGLVCDTSVDGGQCVTCTETVGCGAGRICDTDVPGGACIVCSTDDHCPGDLLCDTGVEGGACVNCIDDESCGEGLLCDTSVRGNRCVECIEDAHCEGASAVCLGDGSCGTVEGRASTQIAAIKMLADGSFSGMPVQQVIVTYLKPAVPNDQAGFFVQAEMDGPAIFVQNPGNLDPAPAVGSKVSFTATGVGTNADLREITSLTDWSVVGTGDVSALITDVTDAADLVTGLRDYESRILTFRGSIESDFAGAGGQHVSAQIATAAIHSDARLKLRIPRPLLEEMGLERGCSFVLDAGPMWRFRAEAQPAAYYAADFSAVDCPAPEIVDVAATSETTITISFSRAIDVQTATGFTVAGLEVTGVEVDGATVRLATEPQVSGVQYTLTVPGTVADLFGKTLGEDAQFVVVGFQASAKLLINEANVNVTGAKDLVELLVIQGGPVGGMFLQEVRNNPTTLATFPDLTVATGDIIVVHLNPDASLVSETVSKTQSTAAAAYATAWDFAGGTAGIGFGNRVLAVKDRNGTIVDAVPFVTPGQSPAGDFPGQLQALQAAGLWSPQDCSGALCTYESSPTAFDVSVDWRTTNKIETSVQRIPGANTKHSSDWMTQGPSTFGRPNTTP